MKEFGQQNLSKVFLQACSEHDSTSAVIDDVMQKISDYEAEQGDDRTIVLIRRGGRYTGK